MGSLSTYQLERSERLKVTFFSTTKICSRDCSQTILDIGKRFFATNRKRNGAKSLRATFFDFVPRTGEESDKVENYRFLENCSIEIAENRREKSVLNALSPPIIKNFKIGSENFPAFFDFTCAHMQNFQKNRFFQIFTFALLIFSAERVS